MVQNCIDCKEIISKIIPKLELNILIMQNIVHNRIASIVPVYTWVFILIFDML